VARCAVLLGLSSPTDAGLCVSYVWDSRHVTEPSEGWFRAPAAIGYVAKGGIADHTGRIVTPGVKSKQARTTAKQSVKWIHETHWRPSPPRGRPRP